MNQCGLFSCSSDVVSTQIINEIHFQLYHLQVHCIQILSKLIKPFLESDDQIINLLKSFLEYGIGLYNESNVDISRILHVQSYLLKMVSPYITEIEKMRISRIITVAMIFHKLIPFIDKDSNIISDILYALHNDKSVERNKLKDLQNAFINEPFLSEILMEILNLNLCEISDISLFIYNAIDECSSNSSSLLKFLQIIGQKLSFDHSDQESMKKLLTITDNKTDLLKHITIEISLKQTPEQRYKFSKFLKNFLIENLLSSSNIIPDVLINIDERLCYYLIVQNSNPLIPEDKPFYELAWLILITNPCGLIKILLSVIHNLIESKMIRQLCCFLQSKCLMQLNPLLLVKLWHPDLANVATMEVLLDTCFPSKSIYSQMNYVEQLCLKIRTRWDTLKKFNSRLNSLNQSKTTYNYDILSLTTMGNTSHLELITSLSDPTGLDENTILDLIERTGYNSFDSLSTNENIHLESEILENDCDKSIYFSALSIRKVWECIIHFSSISTRQTIIRFLHQNNLLLDVELVDSRESFYIRFRSALQENNLQLLEEIYQNTILCRLDYLKSHVNLINPLSLRLELLENIYSLLFVTEYDLFNPYISNTNSSNSRNLWPFPETIKSKYSKSKSSYGSTETIPKLDRNKFVCSFFLCKDLLVNLENNLKEISSICNKYSKTIKQQDFKQQDLKMSKYINYPAFNEIKTRIDILSKSLHEFRWRIDFLTTNSLDYSYNSIGIIDMSVNVIFDSNSRQLSDIFRPRVTRKIRSRSNTLTYKPQVKRKTSVNVKKEKKNIDYMDESFDEESVPSNKFESNINRQSKDAMLKVPCNRETSTSTSENDNQLHLASMANTNKPKMNCHFLMESVSWFIQPVEHLAITALVCGYHEKAKLIVEMYSDIEIETKSPLLLDLLTEIQYRGHFDKFIDKLKTLKTPCNQDEILTETSKSIGHFDWKKLPALSAKISSNKENEIVEIVNHLLMLNFKDRPCLKIQESDENKFDITSSISLSNKIKDFDSGLLFDLALNGATTKWQLVQMLNQVEGHFSVCKITDEIKSVESGDYFKLSGLKPFVKQLQNFLSTEYDNNDNETYTSVELRGSLDVNYSMKMQKWLNKVKVLIKELKFNIKNSLEFQSYNPDSETRLTKLANLKDYVKTSLNDSEMPFKYLFRNVPQYLESLENHLQIFAKFLDDHKQTDQKQPQEQSTLSSKQQSYLVHAFSVLKRSPSDVLGELIFFKLVDPLSNEILKVSHDLGLNISEVILENCIPTIYSVPEKNKLDTDSLFSKSFKQIRNQPDGIILKKEYNLHPMEVVTNCLETVFQLLLKNSFKSNQVESILPYNNETVNDSPPESSTSRNWKKVIRAMSTSSLSSLETISNISQTNIKEPPEKSNSLILVDCDFKILLEFSQEEEWIKILKTDIVDLCYVDLNLLTTNNEKTAFFINLYNLMMIHMMVWILSNDRLNLKFRSYESRRFRENFYYNVGQIGSVSLFEISQYYLNIPDVTFSDVDVNPEDIVLPFPVEMEQLYRNNCPILQTLAIFSLCDGTVSGPPLKIYKSDSILPELQNNLSYIISCKTYCDSEKRQIQLPQIFKWYNKQIQLNFRNKRYSSSNINKSILRTEENLIERILSHCNEEICRKYSHLLRVDSDLISYNTKESSYPKSIKIIWLSRSEAIGCSLIGKTQDICSNVSKLNANELKIPSIKTENSSVSTRNQASYIPSTNYHPRTVIIDHLRQNCPILCCLVYTIIGEDFLITANNVDCNNDSKQTHEDLISEIYSYKFSRLQDHYSSIGKWIIRYWSPWHASNKDPFSLDLNLFSYSEPLLAFCRDSIPIEIRWAAFSHPLAKNLDKVLIDYSIQYMNRNPTGYFLIGSAIRNLHSLTTESSYDFQCLLDMILVKSAHYWATGLIEKTHVIKYLPPDNSCAQDETFKYKETRLLDCLFAIKNSELLLSESLRYLNLLNIDNVVSLMEINSKRLYPKNEIVLEKLEVFRIFKRIHNLVAICQSKEEIFLKALLPTEFLNWPQLQFISENNPNEVFKFLIQQKQFDLCRKWCRYFMKENGEEKTTAEFLVSFVNEENDKEKIVGLISHITKLYKDVGIENFLKVIHHVIAHSESPLAIIICCAFIIKGDLFSQLTNNVSHWQNRIKRAWCGASMIRSIPTGLVRDLYSHLIEHPSLILEQLLMNSEVDLFRKMIELLKEQKKAYLLIKKSQTVINVPQFNAEEFIEELEPYNINKLLIEYIFKALELPAVKVEEESEIDELPMILSRRGSVTSVNESSETINSKRNSKGEFTHDSQNPSEDTFNISHLLSPDKWIQDREASVCMCCNKEVFSMFNRRHHCRKCGWVICEMCSTHRTLIKGVTVRICNKCHKNIQDNQYIDHRSRHGSLVFDENKYRSNRDMIYSRHNVQRQCDSPRSNSSNSLTNADFIDVSVNVTGDIEVGNLQKGWRLSVDSAENDMIRQMFFYDDAPSITMGFSLTYFHSNSNECGNSLLDRVEYLAEFLKPMKTGLPNSEVDYLLVIDIAKRITYKAKEKFSYTNNDVDFARAEVYLSRLDLLGILVRSNYSHILPSLSDGSKFIEKIKYLRDKLIAEERLDLARIVSNKASLSSYPVFIAMGLHDLEEGKYEEARKLFKSCIQSGHLSSSNVSVMSYPLTEIMKILERPGLSVDKFGEMIETIKDTEDDLLKCPELKYIKDCDISQKQIEEAIFYFELFNAPLHHLKFLCRQQIWSKAVDFVLKKNVSKDVFIEGLIVPTVTSGMFSLLKSEMLMREGGLLNWKIYYESLCAYLDKTRCFNDLLEIQEIYGDHLRAATTLIKHFYLAGATSYVDLAARIPYLEKAHQHFTKLIRQNPVNSNPETEKYIKYHILIKEQIEATRFLSDQISIAHHQEGLGYLNKSVKPPTLFDRNPDAFVDLCLMILFCRPNILDGLQKLYPMMPQCHIYPEKILPKAAAWLLENPKSISHKKNVNPETLGIDLVLEFCGHICTCYRLDSRKSDEILISILSVIPSSRITTQIVNKFTAFLNNEQKKIEAYILVKDFKRAYVNAVKLKYVSTVERILELAKTLDDKSDVIDLCQKWLSANKPQIIQCDQ